MGLRRVRIKNERGTALLEALPTSGLLFFLIAGLLAAAYLMFAKASVQYQSEQALYCASQGSSRTSCEMKLQAEIQSLLPWGDISAHIQGHGNIWSVEATWRWKDFSFHVNRVLGPKQILAPKALLF